MLRRITRTIVVASLFVMPACTYVVPNRAIEQHPTHAALSESIRQPTRMRWRKDVAVPADDGDGAPSIGALAAGHIALETPEHQLCSFRESDGAAAWCISRGHAPIADGRAFLIVSGDTVDHVDASTGKHSWRYVFPRGTEAAFAAPIGNGLAVAVAASAPTTAYRSVVALDDRGTPRWSTSLQGRVGAPRVIADHAFLPSFGTGATFDYRLLDVAPADAHAVVASVDGVRPPLLRLGSNVVAVADRMAVLEPALTAEIDCIDILTGGIVAHAALAPEYDENRARFETHDTTHRSLPRSAVRFEKHYAYMSVVDRIYRYDVLRASLPPLRVSDDGAFVGGPSDDTIYVARGDGVWAIHAAGSRVEARLVVASREPFAAMTIDGDRAYVAFADGSIRGFAEHDGRSTFAAVTRCAPTALIASATNLYAVCRFPTWSVSAFPRT